MEYYYYLLNSWKEAIEFNNYIINTYKVDSKCFKLDVTSEKV